MATVILVPNSLYSKGGTVFAYPSNQYVEAVTAQNDGKHIYETDSNELALYNLQDTTVAGKITSVQVTIYTKVDAGTSSGMAVVLRTHNTNYETSYNENSTSWTSHSSIIYNNNPYTGSAWTWNEINSLIAGVRLVPSNDEYNWYVYCDYIEVIVTYDPYIDIGLRLYDGSNTIQVACEPSGTLTSALRIRKGATTYGIVLVDTTDSNASKIRINTSSGIKAIAKL